jgi:NRPS condensation-like uncharacterized protein
MVDNFINKDNIEDVFPMSDIQKGLIFHSIKESNSSMYISQLVSYLPEIDFDQDLFNKAFELLVIRHPMLRTVFQIANKNESLQIVLKKIKADIVHYDIKLEKENFFEHLTDNDTTFDFSKSQLLWRIRTFKQQHTGKINVLWVIHHSLHDGWSFSVLVTDLIDFYYKLLSNSNFKPKLLKASYKDHIVSELLVKKGNKSHSYWKNELADFKRVLLPVMTEEKLISNSWDKYICNSNDKFLIEL